MWKTESIVRLLSFYMLLIFIFCEITNIIFVFLLNVSSTWNFEMCHIKRLYLVLLLVKSHDCYIIKMKIKLTTQTVFEFLWFTYRCELKTLILRMNITLTLWKNKKRLFFWKYIQILNKLSLLKHIRIT